MTGLGGPLGAPMVQPLLQCCFDLGNAPHAMPPERKDRHHPPRVLLYSCSIISLLTVITRELAW